MQIPVEDGDLENSHPAEKADLEAGEGEDVCFEGAEEGHGAVLAGHGRDGEVLEDDAEAEGEAVICWQVSLSLSETVDGVDVRTD